MHSSRSARPNGREPDMPETTTLRVEVRDPGIGWITLDRPQVLNAFDDVMKLELRQAIEAFGRDASVRCVVITGAGKGFCSGQDLEDRDPAGPAPDLGETLRTLYNPLILAIRRIEKPVIAAINGVAAGAGLSLALACDMRIASQKARLIEVFARVGLVPDAGSTYYLPRLVGLGRAFEMMALAGDVDAATAERWGLVNQVVPPEQLESETMALALRLAQAPTRAIALIKRSLERSFQSDLGDQLELEAHMQQIAGRSEDFREGVSAFLAKRAPHFEGR